MKRLLTSLLLAAVALTGCQGDPAINRVGLNVLDKDLFTGSWYYSSVVIDVDYAASGLGTYPGDAAIDFTQGGLTPMPRVRWVIDEDTLFAYRDFELIEGFNTDREGNTETPGDQIHHPVAAFGIDAHFDIRREYNPATGEENNVIVENSTDRRWYERDYMRVDWSQNLIANYYGQVTELYEVIGLYDREPSTLFVQGASDFPEAWRPQFDFMQCSALDDTSEGCSQGERDYAEDYETGEFYHFSFVTQDIMSPGTVPNPFTGRPVNYCLSPYSGIPDCASTAVYVRNSFLKVSDTREYEAENWSDSRFDRHGYFRLERDTYDRSTGADDPAQGRTDFNNFAVNRHNIWRQWNDEAGNPIPYAERDLRPIVFYTSSEMPAHLIEPSYDLSGAWNQVFIRMVRNLRGQDDAEFPRVDCQTTDPDAYCYCTENPENGQILNPTCTGSWDPFKTPDEQAAAGVTNPYDCYVSVPAGAQPDMENPALSDDDFYGWYGAEFVGAECVFDLRINTCNRESIRENGGNTDGMDCQARGDMRYKLLSYVDQPGTPFLGVATLRGDPVTGEIRAGDANIGGPALDGYRTFALQNYDLINGTLDDRTFIIGEDVRDYLENVDRIQQAEVPREPYLTANVASAAGAASPLRRGIENRMNTFVQRAELLQGNEGRARIFSDRINSLAGSEIERRMMANQGTLALAGIDTLPPGVGTSDINDAILDRASPFRRSPSELLAYQRETETRISTASMMMPNEFVDASVLEFVNRHADWNRAKLEIVVNQLLFYQTELHELGHCLGLRHDFGASTDIGNYDDDYYIINDALPTPNADDFDMDGINGLNRAEQLAFQREYDRVKDLRELAGADRWMNSSIMEYTAQWYERTSTVRGAGRYDHAAISNAYGDLTEVYDNSAGLTLAEINPVNTPRTWIKYYHGGETCQTDADCPYSTSGSNASLLLAGNMASGLTQTCVAHPNGADRGNICSGYDNDITRQMGTNASPAYVSVNYNFCTDDLVGYRADCHRFDEGDSYREIVSNIAAQYNRQYLFTNFRRYKTSFGIGGYIFGRLIGRQYNILQTMFQNLLFNYVNDEGYAEREGAFGFEDHYLAAADTVNFYSRVISQPALGAYRYDEGWGRYIHTDDDPATPGAQLVLPFGTARYSGSEYATGQTGITRLNRIGTFYEKWFTMRMLTERGGGSSYSRDVPFWTNYYDLFPQEIQQIMQGMILNQPERISPRVVCNGGTGRTCENPQLLYIDHYRGDCRTPETCRESPEDRYGDMEYMEGGAGATLQFLASIFALGDIPVFYDTTFQNQMFVCVVGEGSCPQATVGSVEGVDYVDYTSRNYGKTFRAWQVEGTEAIPNQTSIGFDMISEAVDQDFILTALKTYRGDFGGLPLNGANLTPDQRAGLLALDYTIPADTTTLVNEIQRIDRRIRSIESFFFQVQQLLRQFGIASYLRF